MLMAILSPGERRQRTRRRLGLGGLAGGVLLATLGAWAAAQAQGRYTLLVVDTRTGEVVSRAGAGDGKPAPGPSLDWSEMIDGLLRGAAGEVADRLQAYADDGEAPRKAAPRTAPPTLAGGPPPRGLRILVTDAWAAPGGVLQEP